MVSIPRNQAVSVLRENVEDKLGEDDLIEVYNELFPEAPAGKGNGNGSRLRDRIIKHIEEGLESEEIADLWNVVFPEHREVLFDEETDSLEYSDAVETSEELQ